MKVLTAHLPEPLAASLDEAAARLDRSRAWIVKQALEEWLSRQASPPGFAEAGGGFDFQDKLRSTPTEPAMTDAQRAFAALKKLRETTTLGDITWQELRDAGRK